MTKYRIYRVGAALSALAAAVLASGAANKWA
jgi:hypothetical protein